MLEFDPQELAEWSDGRWERRPGDPVRGFAFDSRLIGAGELFVCLKTEQRDGHDFLAQAMAAGAAGAIVDRVRPDFGLPQLVVADPLQALWAMATRHRRNFPGPVVAITGSCGKTSTKEVLALLLGGKAPVHATAKNLNNLLGVPLTLLGLDPKRHWSAVVEAGINQLGEMAKLAAMIQPSHTLVTVIAPAHLEKLGDLAGVAKEKAVLAQAVPHSGAVVFPASCLLFEPFHEFAAAAFTIGVEASGVNPDVSYRLEQTPESTVLHIDSLGTRQIFTLRKASAGMVSNAVLAIEMARILGVSDPEIQERLPRWRPAPHRGEVVEHGSTRFYLDCYNSNPAAMEDSLEFFNELAADADRRLYVLGCMGELGAESSGYHRDLGRGIRLGAGDRIFITGGDEVEALREGLLAAGNAPEQIRVFAEIGEIEDEIIASGAFVFVKGSRVYALEKLVERAALRAGRTGEC